MYLPYEYKCVYIVIFTALIIIAVTRKLYYVIVRSITCYYVQIFSGYVFNL